MNTPNQQADLAHLTQLVHRRWNILVIAELRLCSGAKFITLIRRLNVSRGSLSSSLSHLIDLGLVLRNTGHGHPMRPEYLLSSRGAAIGDECIALVRLVQRGDETELAFRKWTLPLVAVIGEHRLRFNQLRSSLRDASPRAITIGLKSLIRHGWAGRTLIDDFPPTAGYELKPRGRRVLICLEKIGTSVAAR